MVEGEGGASLLPQTPEITKATPQPRAHARRQNLQPTRSSTGAAPDTSWQNNNARLNGKTKWHLVPRHGNLAKSQWRTPRTHQRGATDLRTTTLGASPCCFFVYLANLHDTSPIQVPAPSRTQLTPNGSIVGSSDAQQFRHPARWLIRKCKRSCVQSTAVACRIIARGSFE